MALNMRIESTIAPVEVPEDIAADLLEAYQALAQLPSARQVTVDFNNYDDETADTREARLFVRQAKAWAESQGLKFTRKGDPKGQPTRVSFRIYEPKAGAETETEDSEAE